MKKKKSIKITENKFINFLKRRKILVGTLSLLIIFSFYIFYDLPSPTRLGSSTFPASTLIFDRNGELLYEIYADKNRTPIKLEEVPDYVK